MTAVRVFNLANVSRSFATRTRGEEVAKLVLDFAAKAEPGGVVVDWDGVSAASPSFVDEFVNGIQRAGHAKSRSSRISFTSDNPGIIDLVDAILRRRESSIRFTSINERVESV